MARAEQGKNDSAAADYCSSRAFNVARIQAAALFARASLALKAHDAIGAARHAEHILQLFPGEPEAMKLLSECARSSREAASLLDRVSSEKQTALNQSKD